MTTADAREFLARLAVTQLETDIFSGTCSPAWPGRAFGGQLAAQSLQAAAATRGDSNMHPWSLHMYFHAPVRANEPAQYTVDRIRDGRTTATRGVRVIQDGKHRATAMVLFGTSAAGPTHQYAPPETLPPHLIAPEERLVHPTIVPPDADFAALGYPVESLVELRIVESSITDAAPDADPHSDTDPSARPNTAAEDHHDATTARKIDFSRQVWIRVLPDLPDDPITSATTMTYLADVTLGTTALTPHGGRWATTDLQLGAVELALWFTGPARLSDWTLFTQDTAFTGRGHGLAHGVFYNSEGELCGLAMQNALMRRR